ncbi:MAG TPA: hypothetical protein VIZ65_04165 [Cellvibrionaceae bacterium]
MKIFSRCLGVFTLFFFSAISHAELIYSPKTVLDTATGTTWREYSTLEAGILNGFKPATVEQTATLFLDYAPRNSGGKLPGYNPEVGGVISMMTSEDGTSFSISTDSSWYYKRFYPPSLLDAFGHNVEYGGGFGYHVSSLLSLVKDGDGWASVLIQHNDVNNQYGEARSYLIGVINPSEELFQWYEDYYIVCPDICYVHEGNPYRDVSGALKIGGYLMVSSVPELPSIISLFAGVLCLSLFLKAKHLKILAQQK